jgi:hypothetical protein
VKVVDAESGMGDAGLGLQKKKLLKIMMKHHGKSKAKGVKDE